MARSGVTYEEVELAAERVLQEGESPTIDRVRIQLGGTGSHSTLSKYLNQWKNQRLRASTDVLPAIQVPSDPVNEAVKKVWQQLQADNAAKMEELVRATDAQIQQIQTEKRAVEQAFGQVATDNDSLRALLRDERAKNDTISQEVITLQQDLAVYQEKAAQCEQRALHMESTYPAQFNVMLEKHQQAEQHYQQQLSVQREDYQLAMASLKEQMEKIRHQQMALIDELRTENHKTNQQLTKSRETVIQLQTQTQGQDKQLQNLLTEKKQWMETLSSLSSLNENLTRLGAGQSKMQADIVAEIINAMEPIPSRLGGLEHSIQELLKQQNKKTVKYRKSPA